MTADEVQLPPSQKMARSGGIAIGDGGVPSGECGSDDGWGWVRLVGP